MHHNCKWNYTVTFILENACKIYEFTHRDIHAYMHTDITHAHIHTHAHSIMHAESLLCLAMASVCYFVMLHKAKFAN